ncbi:hypothetical protein FOWG_09943 [Fusarium oxysporum f. sp. lycopersici MN25]|uniref:Uncharacterized protein n=1 Tax=Fusarium oxysporum Fo47 TaxID=660027 RepID=W9JEB5_FUSOX|nr:hypothetical protein FOZG_17500 [Fusarium oxysporum Fo47]EWZ86368.1 hypothetical protein FOWG_09943 [Fusarium oxysporum f. sp. lycopersici MN25]
MRRQLSSHLAIEKFRDKQGKLISKQIKESWEYARAS